ncbi:hypothetical protein CRENPOLYSF1_890056 [Crenothrix polyspora]|jgi:hypothetical protein|uniref:Uncharacterized protein n=1 Tax=Crenothrix polyspora TaxID=360316 RepID=A0A1R4HJJ1_9GAMM|nr:hypothetical protein CRENPOLYSF1_890056 [Crenothrix polyspora]
MGRLIEKTILVVETRFVGWGEVTNPNAYGDHVFGFLVSTPTYKLMQLNPV